MKSKAKAKYMSKTYNKTPMMDVNKQQSTTYIVFTLFRKISSYSSLFMPATFNLHVHNASILLFLLRFTFFCFCFCFNRKS